MTDASARARPDWQPTAAPTAPTPSMLAYAFGERVAPQAARLGGKLIPCSGRMVDGDELAITMVQIALWDLQRREVVALELSIAPGSNESSTLVRPAVRAQLDQEFKGSLEYLLLRAARSGRQDREVGEVVAHLYPREVADPFTYVFELQNEAMVDARLMRRDTEGRVAVPGAAPVQGQLVWVCERVAQQLVGFTRTLAEWERDRGQDPEEFERMHRAIRAAIESRWDRVAFDGQGE